ncbi:hypothetical protein [Methyloglobulus sp.]|uniref:hypothetical protein n=1 Tax=Methyloglobulus sp. TaxID=2518622 RepID=UPI0032B76987
MRLKLMKIFAVVMLINALLPELALADTRLPINTSNTIVRDGLEAIETLLTSDRYSIKKGQPYDSSNDPAIKSSSGGPSEGPQHGYFAVPLIVIGLAGILLYFSKFN